MAHYPDIHRLKQAGYTVKERSPWHFQVIGANGVCINIWPTKRKWMVEYGGGASHYTDILEVIKQYIGAPGQVDKNDPKPTMDRLAAEWRTTRSDEEWQDFHSWREGVAQLVREVEKVIPTLTTSDGNAVGV